MNAFGNVLERKRYETADATVLNGIEGENYSDTGMEVRSRQTDQWRLVA